MSRTTEKKQIDKEDIKARWEEIFRSRVSLKENGGKLIGLCPFHVESSPSFTVFDGGGYKCFGCGRGGGDVIQFIMELEGKTFVEALENIKGDFVIEKVQTIRKPTVRESILYEFDYKPFDKEHHRYWNKYWLSEKFVEERDIFAVKDWAINKKKQVMNEEEIMFCYVFKNESGKETGQLKFLRLGNNVPKADKWRTNVPNKEIWYLYKYVGKPITQLFVAKSNKDALVNMYAGIDSVATQSENDKILAANIPRLKKICPNLVLNFGSDDQGRDMSISVSKEFDLPWFNTNREYLKNGINDNAEYQAEFGPECYKQLLIDKKWI